METSNSTQQAPGKKNKDLILTIVGIVVVVAALVILKAILQKAGAIQ
jgi:flagellar basal body-associated protein FliL